MLRRDRRLRLTAFGLTIDSDRPIAGACTDERAGHHTVDVVIDTSPPEPAASVQPPLYQWDGETLIFSAPGVGRFHCRRDRIAIVAERGSDEEMVAALLVATALPAVIWLRGDIVLHAAALVSRAGFALGIAGASGVGKSTVTQQLLAGRANLLADDTIRVTHDSGAGVAASGLPAGYHLAQGDETTRGFHPVAEERRVSRGPLHAIAILSRCEGPPALVRLDGVTALQRLITHQHRPKIPAALGRRRDVLLRLGAIAKHCAIYDWRRSSEAIDDSERAMLAAAGFDIAARTGA